MSTIQSSMSSGAGTQASSIMISSTPNETGALATRMAVLVMEPPGMDVVGGRSRWRDHDLHGLARAQPGDPGQGLFERDRGRDHRGEIQRAGLDEPDRRREGEIGDIRAEDRQALLHDL